ncbi:MAG: hypothetical protein J6K86_05295 [Clostridia bacterium]|nr:hypothetical protein [Clostridia bacterium]
MKLKKIALAVAATLALSSLAACTDNDQKLSFKDYWEKDSLSGSSAVDEKLTYKITHEKEVGLDNLPYVLTYGEGTYVTTLKTHSQGYIYSTSLTMPVTYKYGDDDAHSATDTVTTEVIFLRSNDGLRPISSTKNVVSHTPSTRSGGSSETCFLYYDYSVVVEYPTEGDATATITDKSVEGDPIVKTSSFTASDKKYSYLDNELLLLALRAIPSSTTTGSVKVYSPYAKAMQKIDLTFASETGGEFSYLLNGEEVKTTITYRPISLTIDDRNPGGTQTAWIAKTSNASNNTYRNMMLKLSVPLSYSLGNLVYTLSAVDRAN